MLHCEEEIEIVDPREAIVEQCRESKCHHDVEHLQSCSERVENGSEENCIEEFFHLMHCVDECQAPKLFSKLK